MGNGDFFQLALIKRDPKDFFKIFVFLLPGCLTSLFFSNKVSVSGAKWKKVGDSLANFRGINVINLDAKGRLAMPVRYRDQLIEESNGRLILTIDAEERCLLLYPYTVWEEIEKKIEALSSFNPHTRRIQRLLIGHATEMEFDNSGRILLPQPLRDYAALEKNIVLVGQGKKFEIWDEKSWESGRDGWLAQGLSNANGLPEELLSLSL